MKLIIGITGASGVLMGYRLLEVLSKNKDVEIHLIVSENGKDNFKYEMGINYKEIYKFADYIYDDDNMASTIASGSNHFDGMIVIPCSMKTLAAITCGYTDNLITRAVDVSIKENRKTVLVPRETPLSHIHLKNMTYLSSIGVSIIPPILTFYNESNTLEEQVDHIIGKVLSQFKINFDKFRNWEGK